MELEYKLMLINEMNSRDKTIAYLFMLQSELKASRNNQIELIKLFSEAYNTLSNSSPRENLVTSTEKKVKFSEPLELKSEKGKKDEIDEITGVKWELDD